MSCTIGARIGRWAPWAKPGSVVPVRRFQVIIQVKEESKLGRKVEQPMAAANSMGNIIYGI